MSRTIQNIYAYATTQLICAECGSLMITRTVQGGAFTRARCMARHCANRNLAGEMANPKLSLLVVEETVGQVVEELPEPRIHPLIEDR